MLIVESLVDGKRMPTYARDKIVSLADVSMFTEDDDIALNEVLTKLGEKEGLKVASIDPKKADNDALRAFFAEVLPNYDRDRVYPSDIRKLVIWYNILIQAGITDFTVEKAKWQLRVRRAWTKISRKPHRKCKRRHPVRLQAQLQKPV